MKIAIVGCAHIHTPSFVKKLLLRRGEHEVVSVWDHNSERAQKYAAELGAPVADSLDFIWADRSIEAVVILSETCRHRDLILRAAQSRKHVFAEKPLGMTAADSAEIADAVEAGGKIFQTGYFMRGMPVHQFLRNALEQGWFGTVTRARHTNCHSGLYRGYFDGEWRWMANPEIAGCGAFGDLGTHSLDILMQFFGMPERVFAAVRTLTGRYGSTCDEYGEGTLMYAGGLLVTLAAGWLDEFNPVTCEICGTRGHAMIVNGELYFQSELVLGSDIKVPVKELPAALPHAFDLYLDALNGQKVPLVSVREAADRCRVMSALYVSARSGKTAELQDL